ncbi:MAG: GTP diphosphokinase [Gammaproteobacteria bacterium]|nr:GTP diphosphokinase [Gammaproteobacteria bacterium]
MQKTKPQPGITQIYSLDEFLQKLIGSNSDEKNPVRRACEYVWHVQDAPSEMPGSLHVALILKELGVDETTLVVTLLSDRRLRNDEFSKTIAAEFGDGIKHLVDSVLWLHEFHLDTSKQTAPEQAERLRRMLLAMVDDVRVVLIKLAYRVQRLRELAKASDEKRYEIARETLDIYAPLANRLGIGQLKWELEDLSFRYLEPNTYRRIATLLEERREEREQFIVDVVDEINSLLTEAGIKAEVYGRPKHIYSIWKKMSAKQKDFHELFDVRAIRITVETVAECYVVLGLIHGRWRHIAKEFDDYIANPKSNGYQSLHTAVYGSRGKALEVQIRTKDMHQFAEFGVAAHWRYKEGSASDASLERSISSLRKLLDPDETQDEELLDSFKSELFSDRVFVLTPDGKVMDLPQGATPLDFAYAVHTEIGHRCRGAKINGRIVQLTYELKNGQQVEILTTNKAEPSRDWMNPNLGYLKSSRARSKVRSWFKHQDFEQNLSDGKASFDREVHRNGLSNVDTLLVAKHFKLKKTDELFASLGRGDITSGQITSALHELFVPKEEQIIPLAAPRPVNKKKVSKDDIRVRGVGNLLTSFSNCCKPVPGDDIIGFITRGQGVSIHRKDCTNILNLENEKIDRLIEVEWGGDLEKTYPVSIHITAVDRQGLLRDVSKVLADDKVDVIGVNTLSDKDEQMAQMSITVEISDLQQLSRIMDKLAQLQNVIDVGRERVRS